MSAANARNYTNSADAARKLSDDILNNFFNQAGIQDLLNLTSIDKCPSMVFSTAQKLSMTFQELKIYPESKQSILFAPVTDLIPQAVRGKPVNTVAIKERNVLCMEVAYSYIRVFQIYAALALTVIDAVPMRTGLVTRIQQRAVAPLYGMQRGGGGTKDEDAAMRKKFNGTIFEPLIEFFKPTNDDKIYELISTKKDKFLIDVGSQIFPITQMTSLMFKGFFDDKDDVEYSFNLSAETLQIFLEIDGTRILQFTKKAHTGWKITDMNGNTITKTNFSTMILTVIQGQTAPLTQQLQWGVPPQMQWGLPAAAAPAAAPMQWGVPGVGQMKSVFEGYTELKKIYDERLRPTTTQNIFPKAYAVARAMTLLSPLFENEFAPGQPRIYTSQICKSIYDFEPTGKKYMPRSGMIPSDNIYLKSLVALFYDDFTVSDVGVPKFTQTPPGKNSLEMASRQLAELYGITNAPVNFIESKVPFTTFRTCSKDIVLEIVGKELLAGLKKKSIDLLNFQKKHTKDVNNLLSSMFELKKGPSGISFALSKSIRTGGRAVLNDFGKKASSLILRYILTSEAHYHDAQLMFETYPAQFRPL